MLTGGQARLVNSVRRLYSSSTDILRRFPDLRPSDVLSNGRPDYVKMILTSRVYDIIDESPITTASSLSVKTNSTVILKREDLLPVFSFKLRGAYNMIAHLSDERKSKGVIACSAGNHAQGVAFSAKQIGIPATIVMPVATPSIKFKNVSRLGSRVVLYGDDFDSAKAECERLTVEQGMTNIPPFDHPYVIAGQGTIGMELLRQIKSNKLSAVFVAIGGGGLIAGITAYLKRLAPHVKIIGVETFDADAMRQSLEKGERIRLDSVGGFADGTAVKIVGAETFAVCQEFGVDEIVRVNTDEISAAIKDVFEDTRSVLEPSGALTVAGLKRYVENHPEIDHSTQTYVPVLSGANMNFDRLRFVSERAVLGEGKEVFLTVQIPDRPGTFKQLNKIIDPRNVTEFSYRISVDSEETGLANIFTSFSVIDKNKETAKVLKELEEVGFKAYDLTDNEMAKSHGRYLVGGKVHVPGERIISFEFPDRPGALTKFLSSMEMNWNLTLFHYRNHGDDVGKVLAGICVPEEDNAKFDKFLNELGYKYNEETDNLVFKTFLTRLYHNIPKEERILTVANGGVTKPKRRPAEDLNPARLSTVFNTIPPDPNARVLFCLSSTHFPLNLPFETFELLKDRSLDLKNVTFVLTMADKILEQDTALHLDQQQHIFHHSLNKYLSLRSSEVIDRANVAVTSTHHPESITRLFEKLIQSEKNVTYYVVGETNTGKSTLVQKLLIEGKDFLESPAVPKASPKACTTRNNHTYISPSFGLSFVDTPGFVPKSNSIYQVLRPTFRINVLNQATLNNIRRVHFRSRPKGKTVGMGPFLALQLATDWQLIYFKKSMWGPRKRYKSFYLWKRAMTTGRYVFDCEWTYYKIAKCEHPCDLIVSNAGLVRLEQIPENIVACVPTCVDIIQRVYTPEGEVFICSSHGGHSQIREHPQDTETSFPTFVHWDLESCVQTTVTKRNEQEGDLGLHHSVPNIAFWFQMRGNILVQFLEPCDLEKGDDDNVDKTHLKRCQDHGVGDLLSVNVLDGWGICKNRCVLQLSKLVWCKTWLDKLVLSVQVSSCFVIASDQRRGVEVGPVFNGLDQLTRNVVTGNVDSSPVFLFVHLVDDFVVASEVVWLPSKKGFQFRQLDGFENGLRQRIVGIINIGTLLNSNQDLQVDKPVLTTIHGPPVDGKGA
ncbi:hypothetical protein OGAPHI_007157 [Ogataea philodendri]|uniref:Threonine dehydratase n=1 Tax=Ogataea philodendri TaxID=1378263 RepID=A0A9P8SZM6_9ASCO|nr:uncharacterized protein OGAPHI_007157 [Ogataea philodendri]KAH3660571.1 hypothetical protein OGAPHI_007157 [Ogataea philodendri]